MVLETAIGDDDDGLITRRTPLSALVSRQSVRLALATSFSPRPDRGEYLPRLLNVARRPGRTVRPALSLQRNDRKRHYPSAALCINYEYSVFKAL